MPPKKGQNQTQTISDNTYHYKRISGIELLKKQVMLVVLGRVQCFDKSLGEAKGGGVNAGYPKSRW